MLIILIAFTVICLFAVAELAKWNIFVSKYKPVKRNKKYNHNITPKPPELPPLSERNENKIRKSAIETIKEYLQNDEIQQIIRNYVRNIIVENYKHDIQLSSVSIPVEPTQTEIPIIKPDNDLVPEDYEYTGTYFLNIFNGSMIFPGCSKYNNLFDAKIRLA